MRILAVLGESTGINLEADRRLLKQLKDAEVVFLVEPTRQEFSEQLWDKQGWDILFFAGHGESSEDLTTGKLYINSLESLTIAKFKHALNRAIDNGLQFGIFNCCDSLGLARELADLNIPQMVVMRKPVPDFVAQEFFKSFLTFFAEGESFYTAVRRGREKLEAIEGKFPGASWLPVICQNPAEVPPTWLQLRDKFSLASPTTAKSPTRPA